jgi:hypothetical protein
MILIVSHRHDVHAQLVARRLNALDRAVCFLDTSRFGNGALIDHRVGREPRAVVTAEDGVVTRVDDVHTVWYRRPWLPRIADTVTDEDDRRFSLHEWAQAIDGVLLSLDARFVNPLYAHRGAVKPRQLCVAQSVGLSVPDTTITNDPNAASDCLRRHGNRVVHKSLTSPDHHFVETRRWADTDPATLGDLPVAPTIFQAEVQGVSDVRVTVVGEQVFAAEIIRRGDLPDCRLELDASYVPHNLPRRVVDSLLDLMHRLGLVFGTIDMRITPKREYVFFEVNPQGQYLFVEIRTGMPITTALVELLASA